MRYNLFDEDYGRYSEVVVKDRLKDHEDTKASTTTMGHVKIDSDSIVENDEGLIEVSESFKSVIQDEIDGKADIVHEHVSADITDLNDTIDSAVEEKVENLVNELITNTISFVQVGSVINGLIDVNYALPLNLKLKEISALLGVVSEELITLNIEKSTDFSTWSNVFNNPITINKNTNYYDEDINADIELPKNTFLRVRIINSDQTARNMTINITGSKF